MLLCWVGDLVVLCCIDEMWCIVVVYGVLGGGRMLCEGFLGGCLGVVLVLCEYDVY